MWNKINPLQLKKFGQFLNNFQTQGSFYTFSKQDVVNITTFEYINIHT